ncbi:MAG TPA: PAS domain S-box protein [Acidimicrobiales bacterium]|nr:PAS domain S-box protein [Acidimicrobiales bacterium]
MTRAPWLRGPARSSAARGHERDERDSEVIETSTDAYVAMDLAGDIVEWNPQAERLFGWGRQEVLGRRLGQTIIPPAFRHAHEAGIERFRTTGEGPLLGQRAEVTALHRAGHEFPVELTLWATGDGDDISFHSFLHDITERRKGEEARRLLASIVESSEDAIIAQDCAGNILSWNEGAERMLGYSAEEAVGQPVSLIVPPDRRQEVAELWEKVQRGEHVRYHESVRLAKSGARVDVALTISPLRDATGAVIGRSAIARDITEQRWLAGALDDTVEALAKAADEARQAEAVTRQFLADAAHQIRGPIARMRSCAETLLRRPQAEERDRLLAHMVRETSRAGRLVTSLLTMARLDQGLAMVPERCDLVALCTEEVERARELTPHLEVAVTVKRAPDGGPSLDADAVREILANLLDNARRHARRHIEVTVGGNTDMVEIRVSDDGPGLADELVDRAFERFASLDGKGGSGLGLPIARGLARAHDGDLNYEDGAFVLRLPPDKATKLVASRSEP